MKLRIEIGYGLNPNVYVADEVGGIIAKFSGPLAKTFAETFVRALEAGLPNNLKQAS